MIDWGNRNCLALVSIFPSQFKAINPPPVVNEVHLKILTDEKWKARKWKYTIDDTGKVVGSQ